MFCLLCWMTLWCFFLNGFFFLYVGLVMDQGHVQGVAQPPPPPPHTNNNNNNLIYIEPIYKYISSAVSAHNSDEWQAEVLHPILCNEFGVYGGTLSVHCQCVYVLRSFAVFSQLCRTSTKEMSLIYSVSLICRMRKVLFFNPCSVMLSLLIFCSIIPHT